MKIKKRKNVFVISCLMILFACGGKNKQTESADAATADSTVVMTNEKTDSIPNTPQSYSLTGVIGEDKASMILEKNDNNVTGVVTRCEYCEPIDVKGTEILSAEGEVEKQNVTMTIVEQ